MKWLQIALLVVAGSMAGAIVMMLVPHTRPALPTVETPPAVVAQVDKPSPVEGPAGTEGAGRPIDNPPQAGPPVTAPAVEPKPETAPAAPALARQETTGNRERPARRPSYSAPRTAPVPPVTPPRSTVSGNFRGRPAPASPPRPAESHNSGAGVSRTYPEEVPVPLIASAPAPVPVPLPEARPEGPTRPPTPPVRREPEYATPAPPPPPEPHKATLNAGMLIPVRLVDGLSTERNRSGDRFTATLAQELVAGQFVIAERGARVEGQVVAVYPGKANGAAGLTVVLTTLHTSDGQSVAIRTDGFERRADPSSGGDLRGFTAGGSMSKDDGGNGIVTGGIRFLRGKPAVLPSDTRISFRLGVPVTLTERVP